MTRRVVGGLSVAALVVMCGACSSTSTRSEMARLPVVGPEYIDDDMIVDRIEHRAADMIAAGTLPEASQLRAQLRRRRRASLPAPPLLPPAKDSSAALHRARAATLVVCGLYLCENCDEYHARPASGFLISSDGLAVTNYHVVDGDEDEHMVVCTYDGRVVPVMEVLAASKPDDVALLRLGGDDPFVALPLAREAHIGERVHVVSHPDGRFYSYTEGTISRFHVHIHDHDNGNEDEAVRRMQITADYARGSSGGPIVNDAGQVVGMVASTNSVYYHEHNGRQSDLPMVFKDCVPYDRILDLFAPQPQPVVVSD